jgi:hypothetical protein
MDTDKAYQLLQVAYAAVLAEATAQFAREGILERVVERKRAEQMVTGKMKAAQFGITTPEEVFTRLSEIFNCALWTISPENGGFAAEARACKLCAIAKKMNAPAPCWLYCLDPMQGMVKGLDPQAEFKVEETLWNGEKCRVKVTR